MGKKGVRFKNVVVVLETMMMVSMTEHAVCSIQPAWPASQQLVRVNVDVTRWPGTLALAGSTI